MTADRNPQAEQMAHESMVRCLDAQARAVWPQERPLIEACRLPADARILDLGCGTGQITRRLAELLPEARITGVDLEESHLARARDLCATHPRVEFRQGDAFDLEFEADSFDLALCRHMLQAVPEPRRILEQMARVAKPGGRLHLVTEDYSMMHFHPTRLDCDDFWRHGPITFAAKTGSDLRSGRKVFTWLREMGLRDVRVDYVVIDTVRVERETFAEIWTAWRDGYTDVIAANTKFSRQQVLEYWDDMIACIRNADGYAVWNLPVVSGVI